MTQEEKAKAYDEALERLKPLYEQAKKDDNPIWSTYEYLVPELRESEDERIRKALVEYHKEQFEKNRDQEIGLFHKDALTYLEKQKPMYNLEIPAGDVAPAEEDGPFDEDEFLENELSAFLQNYDKEYDDDAAVSDVARHFYEIGKKQKELDPKLVEEFNKGLKQAMAFGIESYKILPSGKVKAMTQEEVENELKEYLADSSKTSADDDERIKKIITDSVFYQYGAGAEYKDVLDYLDKLEKQKDASYAIEAVERIDKYIDEHLANAHDMKDSNPDKKYYRGWDDALGEMARILQDVYSNEKQKEPHYTKSNALFDKCVENCDPKIMKEVSDKVDEMLEKEQKPVQSDEEREYVRVLKSLISDFIRDNYKTTDISFYQQIYDWLDGRHIEQKPTEVREPSDDELRRHQDDLRDFKVFAAKQAREHHISFVHDFEWNNFCEELLSYFNEKQKSVEWSEEDEKILDSLIRLYSIEYSEYVCPWANGDITYGDVVNFLKSLRPQPKRDGGDDYSKGYTEGYNKGYKDANESLSYHFPVMPTTPSGWGCDGTHCTNPHMDCINCPIKTTGGINTASSSGDLTLKAEWRPSEEENRLINTSISFLKDFADKGYENAVECIDWLKSKLNGNTCK